MGREWIIDVLADLRSFARENDLPLLTAQLEEAGLVAEVEIASTPNTVQHVHNNDADRTIGFPTKLGLVRRT